jgi:hypothetical protein
MADDQTKRKPIEPTTADQKPTILPLTSPPENNSGEAPISIPKPGKSSLDMFKSTRDPTIAGVEKLLTPLPHYKISDAKDFARLHHDKEKYWSTELCFVHVPIKGQKRDQLHLINEELAKRFLPRSH